jgi:transposase
MATNSLKSYLNQFTIRLGKRGLSDERTRKWILQQREWSPLQQELLSGYFQELDHAAERRKGLHRLIAQQVCSDPLMLRCMKLLGIGVINAFALLAVIGEVRRFDRPEKLVAYIGLNPGQKQSGRSKKIIIGVGRRGRGDIRSLLIQGAHALMRLGKATPLGAWGWKLFARKGNRNTAVAAVARKLLVQVWHLLSGNPPTMLEPDKSLRLKLHKLVVFLGKELRAEMELPENAAACIMELYGRMLASPGESS